MTPDITRGVFLILFSYTINNNNNNNNNTSSTVKNPELKESVILTNTNSLLSSRMSDRSSSSLEVLSELFLSSIRCIMETMSS